MSAARRIFISYAREDQSTAQKLYEDLERAGFDPWMDRKNLLPGERWEQAIRKQLENCYSVIFLLSDNAAKKAGYFQKEIKVALDELQRRPSDSNFLIPVRLNNVSERDFPELSVMHWADCSKSYEIGKDEVLRALEIHSKNREPFTITLSAKIEDVDLEKLVDTLKELTGDESISIKRVKPGSLVAELDATEEAIKLLERLYRDGDLRDLLGYPIIRLNSGTQERPNDVPKIFISHSHKQKDLAGSLVAVLERAFELKPGDIRCTSLTGYNLPIGAQASSSLRREIEHAEIVIGVITPESIESQYVLFELGASWGFNKQTFPVLAGGATQESLPGPLKELNCILLNDIPSCHEFISQINGKTSINRRNGYDGQVAEAIVALTQCASGVFC